MRNYGKVVPTFWKRGSGKKLRGKPEAQLLALYLMTCEQGSASGIFHMPAIVMAHETGLSTSKVEAALKLLESDGFAFYDDDSELVYVPRTAPHQVCAQLKGGDRRRLGLIEEMRKIGNHRFVADFYARYSDAYELGLPPPGVAKKLLTGTLQAASDQPTSHIININKDSNSDSPPESSGVVDPPQSESAAPKTAAKRGRAARTTMKADWQPSAELRAETAKHHLDVESVIADFRDYWLNDGRLGADWNAAYRNNLRKVLATDWLLVKYKLPEAIGTTRATGPVQPPGEAVSAPPDLLERMQKFTQSDNNPLFDEPVEDDTEQPRELDE